MTAATTPQGVFLLTYAGHAGLCAAEPSPAVDLGNRPGTSPQGPADRPLSQPVNTGSGAGVVLFGMLDDFR
ncbi:hypothetical protein [Streptosporangium roseum]|uniref:hypothetical protein n=1 Tax=Streptosporangium roseum TaxID=2001 RepID=UPI00331EB4F2